MKNNKYIRIGFILIIIGAAGLVLPFLTFGFFHTLAETEAGDSLYRQYITYIQDVDSTRQQDSEQVNPPPTTQPDYVMKSVRDRLYIPVAGVDMPIFRSNSDWVLSKGGWLFSNTSTPDAGGNTVIFGHRFKYLPPISNTLFNLDKVDYGDTFTMTWQGQNYQYVVVEKRIIEPTDLSVLEPSSDSRITIVTCTPLFSTKQRLVIVGALIDDKDSATSD